MFDKVKADLLWKILLLVVAAFLLRAALAAATEWLGLGHDALFVTQDDIFADSLKSGLAERAVSASLLHDPAVANWPLVFQKYLFKNSYIGGRLTIYHSPPFSTLLLMAVAGLLRLLSPLQTVAVLITSYLASILLIVALVKEIAWTSRVALLLLLLVSYPAVWMIDRGNFHSGLTSSFIVLYLLSVTTGRFRALGLIAIALAINLRPNVALILIVEFAATSLVPAFGHIVMATVISGTIAAVAFFFASSIDPSYTLSAFFKGLAVYNRLFVSGDNGFSWNDSLYGAIKSIWWLSDYDGFSSPPVLIAVSSCGAAVAVLTAWLMVTRRTRMGEAAFLGVTLSVLFTPVYAEYHILVLVAPTLILAIGGDRGDSLQIGETIARLALIILLCCVASLQPNLVSLVLLVAIAALTPWTIMAGTSSRNDETTTPLILRASLLALCPLGGELSNGIVIAVVLFASSLVIIAVCFRRPAKPIEWFSQTEAAAAKHSRPEDMGQAAAARNM